MTDPDDLVAQIETVSDPVADDTDNPEFDDLFEGVDETGPVPS